MAWLFTEYDVAWNSQFYIEILVLPVLRHIQ